MEHRARTRLRRAVTMTALGALLVPAAAGAATKHKVHLPVITKVTPKSVTIGGKLTLRGKYFRRGRGRDTVLFKRDGRKAAFVKAQFATRRMILVKVPSRLTKLLTVTAGMPAPTRFRLRVLTTRLGKRFTSTRLSPIVSPVPAGGSARPTSPSAAAPTSDCDHDHIVNANDSDDDNDLLPDTLEQSIGTDRCKADTDGDGVSDAFEYASAKDLNSEPHFTPTPYPGKRPYPNPLDGSDANIDFDGDGLTQTDEYELWLHYGSHKAPLTLNYSDGKQATTAPSVATYAPLQACVTRYPWALDFDHDGTVETAEATYLDRNQDGILSDDELDADGDCLSNWDESHGRMIRAYWDKLYSRETPFPTPMGSVDLFDPDSDGDGIPDGVDDQDHDGLVNIAELSRQAVTHRPRDLPDLDPTIADPNPPAGRVNPYNPCLPNVSSPTCPRYIPFEGAWAPFDGLPYVSKGDDPNYLVLN